MPSIIKSLNYPKEGFNIVEHLGWIAFEGCR